MPALVLLMGFRVYGKVEGSEARTKGLGLRDSAANQLNIAWRRGYSCSRGRTVL